METGFISVDLIRFSIIFISFLSFGNSLVPEEVLQCTVIKVYKTIKIENLKFPVLHQAINNDPFRGLKIDQKSIKNAKLTTTLEGIEIRWTSGEVLKIRLTGQFMSRVGEIFYKNKKLAHLTCH